MDKGAEGQAILEAARAQWQEWEQHFSTFQPSLTFAYTHNIVVGPILAYGTVNSTLLLQT